MITDKTRGDDWDLLWTGVGQYNFMRKHGLPEDLSQSQQHNHCLGSGILAGNKRSLVRRHNHMRDLFGSTYLQLPAYTNT